MKAIITLGLLMMGLLLLSCTPETTIGPQTCDALNSCPEGLECWKLPDSESPICVTPAMIDSLIDNYPCEGELIILESYPPQLQCVHLIGGDKDEHGCIGSAGYSWCESKQKCLRVWEEDCD